ncbi:imelysin family protein [Chryseolinea sp. H1M3-3]|uniref:imelysin family protein n=1 Tax=Chryseolinea sp. H1M3-3 TaxID=3034144 RepID=UPI0023EC071E|nr:imelysin family protein [Chryseolinea sp. H1M3-3]
MIGKSKHLFVFVLALLLSACGGDDDNPTPVDNTKDREAILTHWADNIIKPSYTNFSSRLDLMITRSEAFTATPTVATLQEFRNAWIDAYTEWQKAELFEFGPADKYTIRNFFNIYPADVTGITSNISDPSANLDLPSSYARQGFPALDYLLNGLGDDDAAIVEKYTTDADAAKRLAYIERIVLRMQTLINNVITEWNGAYRDTFIASTGLDIGSSMGAVVNAYVLHYERFIRSGKIGIPAGVIGTIVGSPFPEKVEAFYKKDISRVLAQIAHQAAIDFFNGKSFNGGTEGPSFKSYLNALDAKDANTGTLLSTIIDNQFTTINGKLAQLMPDLSQQIGTDNEAMVDVYTNMQTAVRYLKVDMSSAMSITITYTDNDGD